MEATKIIVSIVLGGMLWVVLHLYNVLVLKPKRIRSKLERQGIKGPSPSFFYGNIHEIKNLFLQTRSIMNNSSDLSHEWVPKAHPHHVQWAKQYGRTFMYLNGNMVVLCISDPETVKELNLQTSLNLGKPTFLSKEMGPLLGQGILTSNGPYWVHQRKIIASELYIDKVKDMVNLMGNSAMAMLQTWENKLKDVQYAEIKVDDCLKSLSADIISRACFGSNYAQGEMIFLKIQNLQDLIFKAGFGLPGLRYVPSKSNRQIWRLAKEIDSMILDIVKARNDGKCEKDLLQSILEAAKVPEDEGELKTDISYNRFIIDNCKNIYFAAYDTTANTLSWCLMLLAANPDWQARVRAEALDICGHELPDTDKLRSLKMLTMVIQETIRLYTSSANVVRETFQDMHFKNIHIPKGTILHIMRQILNHDPDLWGPDVLEFKPERFADGVKGACKIPQAYAPFGIGPHICAGQHFTLAQMKVVLAMILTRFNVSLSPAYRHKPVVGLSIEPEHGVYLNIRRI